MADHAHDHAHHVSAPAPGDPARVRDPVCGMRVDPATSKHRAENRGETFHFCSAGCKAKFEADPGRYAVAADAPNRQVAPPVAAVTLMTASFEAGRVP